MGADMQDLSYSFPTPHFILGDYEFSVMIYTFQNVYAPDENKLRIKQDENTILADIGGLRWAGGQMEMEGAVEVQASLCGRGIRIKASASIHNGSEDIRCIKITLHGIPEGKIINLIDARPRGIPQEGLNLKYPEGWRDVGTPLVIMETSSSNLFYFRSLDDMVNALFLFILRRG
jgi:hypothetical protein